MSNAEKLKALKLTMDKIDKDFGKGSVMMMNEKGENLQEALSGNGKAVTFFEGLTYGYKKEYAEHVTTAKQEKTRAERIAKIVSLCEEGKTLHHKYKK